MTLPERYDPKEAEQRWQAHWRAERTYHSTELEPVFSIDTPPPTVSGKMHLGHAFSYTQGDIIARYHRMKGDSVLYPFGTDDNGLPTERLVEKEKKVRGSAMPRKAFRELCYGTVQELLPEFSQAWKDIGMSANFDHAYSTIDEKSQRVSQQSFLDLYHKGYVYQKESPFAWCVQCQTAIAQAEFDNVELASAFLDVAFTIEGTKKGDAEHTVVIGTSRPELIPACVALCYHPDDARYQQLAGKRIIVPLSGHTIPVIADDKVLLDKGTGLMMVSTFGDKEDIEKWQRHNLPLRALFTPSGTLTAVGGAYEGLSIKDARKRITADLQTHGFLISSKPIKHPVNTHERCGTEVEFLNTKQWFVNVLDHKEKLLAAAREVVWHPEHMRVRIEHWIENLQWDWAISRQRFYGVPFPMWYSKRTGEEGKVLLAHPSQLPVDPLSDLPEGYSRDEVTPEADVMDTWATSSSTPDIVLGFGGERHTKFHPMSVRFQAHDIIRTWAFYTIVKSVYSHERIPWKHIVVMGHVLDSKGQKMSKSKGNVIDPIEVMSQHSVDVIRYWTASSKLGEDHAWQEKDINTAKRLVTKLFNAGKFSIGILADYSPQAFGDAPLGLIDRWLLAKLALTIEEATEAFEQYEYSRARFAIDQFFWSAYCDNYLELVKDRVYNEERAGEKPGAQHAIHSAMLAIVKLYAPFTPYITEEVYQAHFREHDGHHSVHVSAWPTAHADWNDSAALAAGDALVTILGEVRKFRAANQLGMKAPLATLAITCTEHLRIALEEGLADLRTTANVEEIQFLEGATLAITVTRKE